MINSSFAKSTCLTTAQEHGFAPAEEEGLTATLDSLIKVSTASVLGAIR
jgi:hypothetical protein